MENVSALIVKGGSRRYPPAMAWITATTLDAKNVNLQTSQIAAVLDRVQGRPQEGSLIMFAAGATLEVRESPAQLLRSIDTGEHPENPSVSPREAW
jgi:hypothetical protein